MKSTIGLRVVALCRWLVIGLACTAMVACYSFQPVGGEPAELRAELRAGRLVKVGDELAVQTASGARYRLKVVAIDRDGLHAPARVVPFEDIVALQRRELSVGKTLLLAAGVTLLVVAAIGSTANFNPGFSMGSGS